MQVIAVGLVVPTRPYAPTLVAPTNGVYADLSGTPQFVWQYNPGTANQTQTYWQFVITANGGNYLYWSTSASAFQSSAVWNPVSASGVTHSGNQWTYQFPSGAFSNNITYQWAVASGDGTGYGPLSTFNTVNAQAVPVVTVSAPSGTVVTASPVIQWSVSTPAGANQITYEVIIYNSAQYSAAGFVPGTSAGLYDSGVVGSSTTTSLDLSAVPIYLPTATSYRAYVQVAETGGQLSLWSYSAFTTAYTPLNTPSITATFTNDATTGYPYIDLHVTSNLNLLSSTDAAPTATSGVGTWHNISHCTPTGSSNGLTMTPS